MKYAIVHITPPVAGIENHQKVLSYNSLLQKIEIASQQRKGTEALSENVWQIALDQSLPVLALILQGAHANGLKTKILFLDDPEWIMLNESQK